MDLLPSLFLRDKISLCASGIQSEGVTLESHIALFRDPTNQERRFIPLRLDDAPIKLLNQIKSLNCPILKAATYSSTATASISTT